MNLLKKPRTSKLKYKNGTYYDFGTKNTSFIQVAKDLKTNGVENFYFMLRLDNPELEGIDPYSEEVSKDPVLQLMIIDECMNNKWYFLREMSKIPQAGAGGVIFRLNRATCAVIWLFEMGIDSYITIARQIGKTQSILALILWVYLFGSESTDILFFHYDQTGANKNLARLKDQRDLLPTWAQLRFKYREDGKVEKGTNNTQKITNINNSNSIETKGKATSKDAADVLGRGATTPVQYFDEFEFILHIKTILQAAGPAFVSASEFAELHGSAYGRLFSSTAGDLDSAAGMEANQILNNMCHWSEKMYGMKKEDLRDYIKANSENQIVYVEYHYYLLGKDQAWFKSQCRVLEGDVVKIKREILLRRMHGSSLSPYDMEDLDLISTMKGKVHEEHIINKLYNLTFYEPIDRKKIYFVGIDIADGYGNDNSSIIILDPYSLKVVGEFGCQFISPTDLKNLVLVLFRKFIPNGIYIIERNRGAALISDLMKTPMRYRLYSETGKEFEIDEKLDKKGYLKQDAAQRRLTGVATTGKSRPLMFELLEVFIRERKESFVSESLIKELLGLIRKKDRIAAGPGFHDDFVMAFLMCLYVYYYGSDLYRYSFYKGELPQARKEELEHSSDVLDEYRNLQKSFGGFKTNSDFEKETYNEIMRAQKQINSSLNEYSNSIVQDYNYTPTEMELEYEENGGGYFDYSFFDEMNNEY